MEFSKGSNEDSEKEPTDWGIIFAQLIKHYGFNIDEILNLSYPQFKALYTAIFEPKTFNVMIPYLGSGDKNKEATDSIKREENEVTTKEGIMQMIANANAVWK